MLCLSITGFATLTKFTVSCINWEEWMPLTPDATLKYEYRVKAFGAVRTLLFYYGTSSSSTPVVLPVGNIQINFINSLELYIVDSVGDAQKFYWNVTVYEIIDLLSL